MLQNKSAPTLPTVLIRVLFGGLIVLAQGSVVAPFIYTLSSGEVV